MAHRRIAVLGGGNGGRTAAAEFGLAGHEVTLFEVDQFASGLTAIAHSGEIRARGDINGDAPVRVELELADAVSHAEVIMIVVPTNHQRAYARMLGPLLEDGMNVVLMPGSVGSLEFAESVRCQGINVDYTVSEISALPYATRITGPLQIQVFGRRKLVSAGVFPASRTEQVAEVLQDLFPEIEMLPHVIAAGLNNPNPTLHCLGVLLSASRIEYSHGEFYYYEEGMTPQVCEAIEAMDAERIAIGKAFGADVLSLIDTYPAMGYGPKGDNFWSVIRGVRALNGIKGPTEINSRYLTEDVPVGLTIYAALGRLAGLEPVLMESVIHLTTALLGTDFAGQRRTLERCGINGYSVEQVLSFVTSGEHPLTH